MPIHAYPIGGADDNMFRDNDDNMSRRVSSSRFSLIRSGTLSGRYGIGFDFLEW